MTVTMVHEATNDAVPCRSVRIAGALMLWTAVWQLSLGMFAFAAYAIAAPFGQTTNDVVLLVLGTLFLVLATANGLTGVGVLTGREGARKVAIGLQIWGIGANLVLLALNDLPILRVGQTLLCLWALWVLTRTKVRLICRPAPTMTTAMLLTASGFALFIACAGGFAIGGTIQRYTARPSPKRWLQIAWRTDFAAAQREARRTGKPLLVVFVAGGEPQAPC
ncbi:hypothetical protein HRbin17_01837 [bacterium HR17]|uniref:Uncharacterized protein n=1 Tax=Candidatus Fervidibacter japonicus TaxID=2035412 RepID=A0A2H5XDR8_9BACT|nr:hypothetical protein HRbin17_01837 [bacterium HR17]